MKTTLDNAEATSSDAAVDLNNTETCMSRLVNVFNGKPIEYDEGSPMDLFLKEESNASSSLLSNDEAHQKAARFFLNGKPTPSRTPKPSMQNRLSYPVLRYIVFQELPDKEELQANESSVEQQAGASESEKKKQKRSNGPRKPPSYRELCNLSSDLGMVPWLDCITDRVRTRHRRSLETQQQQVPVGAIIRQIKKESVEIKNEPMSVLLQFEQNLQPSPFTLPAQIKKETVEVQEQVAEVKEEVTEVKEESMSVVSQLQEDNQQDTLPSRIQKRKSKRNDENGKSKDAPESKKATPNKALKSRRVNV